VGENHSAETNSVEIVRDQLTADPDLLFVASEYFLNSGLERREVQDFIDRRRNTLGGLMCPYRPLLEDLRRRMRYVLYVGSHQSAGRDLAIARHFIEEHADRKHLRPTSPGVLVLGHHHAARRPGTTRTLLERAGFTILGVGVFTDDIGRDDKLRTDRVFRVGQTTPIHLVDALPQFVHAVAVRTRGTVFERLTHDQVSSLADLYEIVVVARTIPRPCPRS